MKVLAVVLVLVGLSLGAPDISRTKDLTKAKKDDCLDCAGDIVTAIQQCNVCENIIYICIKELIIS